MLKKNEIKTRAKEGRKQYYWCYRDPLTGQHRELTSYSLQKLKKKIAEKKSELADNPQGVLPFGEYLDQYFEQVHSNRLGASSQERYRYVLEKIKHFRISKVPISQLDDRLMQRFYNDLFKQTDSAAQVAEIHKLIRPAIRYAAIRGDIRADFMPLVVKPRDRDSKRRKKFIKRQNRALTIDEEIKFNAYLRQGVKREREASTCMLLLIMLYMGLRVGE